MGTWMAIAHRSSYRDHRFRSTRGADYSCSATVLSNSVCNFVRDRIRSGRCKWCRWSEWQWQQQRQCQQQSGCFRYQAQRTTHISTTLLEELAIVCNFRACRADDNAGVTHCIKLAKEAESARDSRLPNCCVQPHQGNVSPAIAKHLLILGRSVSDDPQPFYT